MEAMMKIAEASNSFSPFTLLKRPLERIHISRGMLKMRMSVMELGRFTLRAAPEARQVPVLIILHGKRERNASEALRHKCRDRKNEPQRVTEAHRGFPLWSPVSVLCGYRFISERAPSYRFCLLGDDRILDLVVGGLGDDLLLHEIELGAVGAAVDDLLRIGVADSRKFLELILG